MFHAHFMFQVNVHIDSGFGLSKGGAAEAVPPLVNGVCIRTEPCSVRLSLNSVSDGNVVELVSCNACVALGECKHANSLETVGAVRDLAEFFESTVGNIKPDKGSLRLRPRRNCCPIEGVLKQAAALIVEVLACEVR